MSFAPPIARDGFYYNGDLYVEVGNLNRHKRASIPEIIAILRPDLKQSKAASAVSPPKEPVGHWYEAQLIHYGLPPSKDKARAKMRLLEALNTSRLVVPEGIVRLERQLKKDYATADRRAKAQYKAEMTASGKTESASTPKKRKQSEPTNSVNVNINFGPFAGQMMPNIMAGMGGGFDVQTGSPATKKPKTSASAAPKKANSKNSVKEPVARGAPAGQTVSTNGESSKSPPKRARPPQTARKSATTDKRPPIPKLPTPKKPSAVKKEPAIKEESYNPPSTPDRPRQTARKSVPIKQELTTHKSPTPKNSPAVKQETNLQTELYTPTKPKLGLINGSYSITCPTLDPQSRNSAMSLILCLDTPSVWGAYNFGSCSGILHLPERPWQPSNIPLSCTWRGQEHGEREGEVGFGEGEIAFWGDGRVEGWINVFGKCHFTGRRKPGPGSAPRSAASMRGEWDGYCDQGYGDEYGDEYEEEPYAEEPYAEDLYDSSNHYAEEAYDEEAY